ncbi:sensor histidine kinase [Calothrix sp. PCC 7507]|uniref:sensor histidine kinase n=1 Tax=Calothrix sp. PCC 7507 TaxID=99598 RepID=UPI00029F00A1|nr:ATP-binding protein [Calothrix sp. PCC 7507]AFY34579.1 integral membrane sensor signal transduction histidine kinase [Calothrix sp. PCC 7507]
MQKSPWFFLIRMAISVFLAETLIMLMFLVLPKLPDLVETFLDATLLTLLITPALYFFFYHPLNNQMLECLLIEQELRHSEAYLKEQAQQLKQTMQKLQQAPQLLLSEKLSSLGRLVAGVAHEINNPVNFIHGNLIHVTNYAQSLLAIIDIYQQHYPQANLTIGALIEEYDLDFVVKDLPILLSSMQRGTERIQKIVLALRNFSRLDESQIKSVNIHDGIDSTLLLLQHRLKPETENIGIKIVKKYDDLPEVECYPGELNQAFMNIISNAIDFLTHESLNPAISNIKNHVSMITICTQALNQKWLRISIKDNGIGINNQIKSQLFEPFFTTKPLGEGIGLGLSISYQIIVHQHGGKLQCISAPGEGAEFIIEIPFCLDQK